MPFVTHLTFMLKHSTACFLGARLWFCTGAFAQAAPTLWVPFPDFLGYMQLSPAHLARSSLQTPSCVLVGQGPPAFGLSAPSLSPAQDWLACHRTRVYMTCFFHSAVRSLRELEAGPRLDTLIFALGDLPTWQESGPKVDKTFSGKSPIVYILRFVGHKIFIATIDSAIAF